MNSHFTSQYMCHPSRTPNRFLFDSFLLIFLFQEKRNVGHSQ